MNDTIAIFASARRHGNTGKFIDWIGAELDIKIIDISEKNIAPFDYDHKNLDDDFLPLMSQLLQYKNILFVTPVYWYAASAQMKTFIDRTADFLSLENLKEMGRGLKNVSAFIVCTSTSAQADPAFLTAFRNTFEYLGIHYAGHVHANCENGYNPDEHRDSVNTFVRLVKQR